VRAVGGYRSRSIGEDFDLVARLHRHLLEKGADYRIHFVPDPMCWTEVPSDLNRWEGNERALAERFVGRALAEPDMLFGRVTAGSVCFALPYLWLFELFAPIVEIGGSQQSFSRLFGCVEPGIFPAIPRIRVCVWRR